MPFLLVSSNWLSLWDLCSIQSWDLVTITVQFLSAVSVFLICVLVGPKTPEEGSSDLEDFFWVQRPYSYATALAITVLSMVANLAYLKTPPSAGLFMKENLTVLRGLIPTVLGRVSRRHWVQWAAGLGLFCDDD